jgi:hypothetical protein
MQREEKTHNNRLQKTIKTTTKIQFENLHKPPTASFAFLQNSSTDAPIPTQNLIENTVTEEVLVI